MNFREQLIKDASEKPHLRAHIIPMLRQGKDRFMGINTGSWADREAAWWHDLERLITEWWSGSRSSTQRKGTTLTIRVDNQPVIQVRGRPTKFQVFVGGQSKSFDGHANLYSDVMLWIDGVIRSSF